jgi:hypothetical protein
MATGCGRHRGDRVVALVIGVRMSRAAALDAIAREVADSGRRRRMLDTIHTRLIGHTWPVAGHVELTEIRDAALRLAEEVRCEVSGPRLAPVTTLLRRDGQPVLGTVES